MTWAIAEAANTANQNHRVKKMSKSNFVSEDQKELFLKKNTFRCKILDVRLTKYACQVYQRIAITSKPFEPAHKCLDCKRFNKRKAGQAEQKKCLLETEFPGYCSGSVVFKRPLKMPKATWENKQCCLTKCSNTLSNFKAAGYKTIDDISKTRRKNLMIVDMRV